jgi:hypothetical protein
MKTSFEKIICPYCEQEHEKDYIPEKVGDGDEFYIECENPECRETFGLSVIVDKKDESPEGLEVKDYLKTNDVCLQTWRDNEDIYEDD